MLQAVRLAGFGQEAAIADRIDLGAADVRAMLPGLERAGLIEHFAFAGDGGWILTERGQVRCAELLREERQGSGAGPILAETLARFDGPNARLVTVISQWQLRSLGGEGGEGGPGGEGGEVVRELAAIERQLAELLTPLVARLPRFGRYPAQFSAALAKADAGDLRWIAGVGLLSCHTVWAELHQDLLSSLDRDRSAEVSAAADGLAADGTGDDGLAADGPVDDRSPDDCPGDDRPATERPAADRSPDDRPGAQ